MDRETRAGLAGLAETPSDPAAPGASRLRKHTQLHPGVHVTFPGPSIYCCIQRDLEFAEPPPAPGLHLKSWVNRAASLSPTLHPTHPEPYLSFSRTSEPLP